MPVWEEYATGIRASGAENISFQHGPLGVTTTEVWSSPDFVKSGDIVRYWYPEVPVQAISYITEYYTIEIDLALTVDSILKDMGASTRTQIRRAAGEDFGIHMWRRPDDEVLESFNTFYDRFAWSKQSSASLARLRAMKEEGLLALSNASSSSGEPLVWHCYDTAANRVRCWYSVSSYHNYKTSKDQHWLARANRYLHYRDIAAFQSEGFDIYDFSGWYSGNKNMKQLAINHFKEELGGRIVKRCYYDVGVTPLGKCWLMLRRARQRAQQFTRAKQRS